MAEAEAIATGTFVEEATDSQSAAWQGGTQAISPCLLSLLQPDGLLGGERFPGCISQGSEQGGEGKRMELRGKCVLLSTLPLHRDASLNRSPASAGQRQQKSSFLVNVGRGRLGMGKERAAHSTALGFSLPAAGVLS